MAGYVPKNKLSKKARKELDRQRRVTWDFSPVTRTVDSRKLYNRRKNTRDRYDDYGAGVFHFPAASARQNPSICRSLAGSGLSFGSIRTRVWARSCPRQSLSFPKARSAPEPLWHAMAA